MDDYDEVITDNPFYKAFQSKAKQLYSLAADNRWLICIPRRGTTTRSQCTLQQFETHVLRKGGGDNDNQYVTYNEKEVKVSGDFITTIKGFSDVKTVRVLFEETFFNPQDESYHVLCIDQPLDGGAFRAYAEPVVPSLETLQNCIDFLWSGGGSRKSRKKIDDVIDLFNTTYKRLETESIRHAMDAANAVFTRAMQTALKEPHLRRPADGSKPFMDSLKVAIESYVMHGLHRRTFKGLCSFLANEDAELNKITRNLADLQVKDLGIKPQICKNIPRAKKVLSNLNRFSTPLEKLYVLKLTVTSVSEVQDLSQAITADDLLPVLVFLVVKSEIPNWLANLTYMYNFHFSKSKNDEFQFYLSSFEAATEYVRTGKLNHLIGLSHAQRQSSLDRLFRRLDSTERGQGPSPVDVLFEEIRSGNVDTVIGMLNKGTAASKPLNEQLCHPLCSCDSCEKLLASKKNDPMAVTVFSRDDMGSTVLHPAAEFDQENLLFQLIKSGAVVNATNYHGSTPLHLACLRGHKKAAIMLTHYGGSINAPDNDGNAPIHLATANGHEKVVEALMLVDSHHTQTLELNAANDNGDTALHIAARWGFTNLVELLLDHGASVEARNKNKETPIHCSANPKVQELLLKANTEEPQEQNYIYAQPNEPSTQSSSIFSGEIVQSQQSNAASPRTNRRIKEFESLLKVVGDGDLEMVKTKLGISENIDEVDSGAPVATEETLCHPLCQCNKCREKQQTVNESVSQRVNMVNEDGVTCLHVASLHGYDRIVFLLLKHGGASPSSRTKKSLKTPLHLACQYNHVECVSLLLKHGAKPDAKDASGNTPLHFCCTNGHISPAILLLQSDANVNTANKRGNTPLHESARWNCPDLVTLLLHYGASLEIRNKSNLTCLQHAQHDDVIEILRNAEAAVVETSTEKTLQPQNQPCLRSSSFRSSPTSLFDETLSQHGDVFHSMVASDPSVFQPAEEARSRRNEKPTEKTAFPSKQRKTTIANLFEAYEEDDKEKIKSLVEGIQSFDKKKKLRRVSTMDKSEPTFDLHLIQMLSIKHFDASSLHHIERSDRSGMNIPEIDAGKESPERVPSYFSNIDQFESFEQEMKAMERIPENLTDVDESSSSAHAETAECSTQGVACSKDFDEFLPNKESDEVIHVEESIPIKVEPIT